MQAASQTPLFHTDVVGGGLKGPTEKLGSFDSIREGTPVDPISLKRELLLTVKKVTALVDVAEADYDTWLSNRNQFIKLLDQGFVQLRQLRSTRATAMDAVRDVLKEACGDASKLRGMWRRVSRALGSSPSSAERDILTLLHEIDTWALPARKNVVEMDIIKRTFRIGEESVCDYLREITTMGSGRQSAEWLRHHFMVQLETKVDAHADEYDRVFIADVRDKILEVQDDLPDDLNELFRALRQTSSFREVWPALGGGSGSQSKRARSHLGDASAPSQGATEATGAAESAVAAAFAALSQQLSSLQLSPTQAASTPPPPPVHAPPAGDASAASTNAALASLSATLQSAIAAFGDAGKGDRGWRYGQKGKGVRTGPGGFPKTLFNLPAIIATGLIWPASTVLTWDNPERIGCADGVNDGLFGIKCPFCGHERRTEMTMAAFKEANGGKGPGSGPNRVPCPLDVALLHRALECGRAELTVHRYLQEHPEHKDHEAFQPMTAEQLAAFKARGG